ncbi:oligosaccharide biosynthesis protein Alg14 like-domain-containing protein [Xylariaceae sp. FL1651]|nr:oligosaccharide biosynthesis protein Alg14 like-domain-containing protein [Xylariaceae sp. FL1651]
MSTNRDQVVQNAIGSSVTDLIKNGVVLASAFAVAIAISTVAFRAVARSYVGSTTFTFVFACIFIVIFLVLKSDAGLVRPQSTHYVLMVCGSGGHTAEMIQMIERSIGPEKSSHRRWAVGRGDEKSYDKVMVFERRLLDRFERRRLDSGTFDIVCFGRARYVHQSWLTTPFTAILSLLDILRILTTPPCQEPDAKLRYPGVIVTNGPGTGFLFLLVARVLRIIRVVPTTYMRTIFVESWARVKSLSLTGKLIRRLKLADLFIVQSRFITGPTDVLAEYLLVMPQQFRVPNDDDA